MNTVVQLIRVRVLVDDTASGSTSQPIHTTTTTTTTTFSHQMHCTPLGSDEQVGLGPDCEVEVATPKQYTPVPSCCCCCTSTTTALGHAADLHHHHHHNVPYLGYPEAVRIHCAADATRGWTAGTLWIILKIAASIADRARGSRRCCSCCYHGSTVSRPNNNNK